MNDPIVQEVQDIRAAIAAEFGYDRTKLISWAREQTRQRKALENVSLKPLPTKSMASKLPATQKRRVRAARAAA